MRFTGRDLSGPKREYHNNTQFCMSYSSICVVEDDQIAFFRIQTRDDNESTYEKLWFSIGHIETRYTIDTWI